MLGLGLTAPETSGGRGTWAAADPAQAAGGRAVARGVPGSWTSSTTPTAIQPGIGPSRLRPTRTVTLCPARVITPIVHGVVIRMITASVRATVNVIIPCTIAAYAPTVSVQKPALASPGLTQRLWWRRRVLVQRQGSRGRYERMWGRDVVVLMRIQVIT